MGISLTQLHKELAKHLLWRLANNPNNALITYGELCSLVDYQVQPTTCGKYLGALSEFCFEHDMPLISAIVVNKDFIPGGGYYGLYRDLTGDDEITNEEIFSKTYKNVVNFRDWGKLAKLLGLEANLVQALNKSSAKSSSISEEVSEGYEFSEDDEMYYKGCVSTISEFTKDLLHEKGFLLDHSNNTRIRFSTERLDSIVGFMGEGWSKQIKRLLLFEIDNREDNYTLKLIIGPGNQEIRNELYTKAKENPDLYNIHRNHLSEQFTTIYSTKILTQAQFSSYSPEQLKKHIEESLEDFIKCDLNPLCEGLRSQQQIELENQLLDIITDDNFDNLEETEKSTCMKARLGHSKLKQILVKKEKCCKVCGLSDTRFLIASHIKPWSKSNNHERLDLNNVLLLCPHHDAAFDKGYITFDQDGMILISSELTLETRALLNLNPERKVELSDKQSEYILWHRENIFHT